MTITQVTSYVGDTFDTTTPGLVSRVGGSNGKYLVKGAKVTVSWTTGVPGSIVLDTLLTGNERSSTDSKMTK
jgi:hypothetical protein